MLLLLSLMRALFGILTRTLLFLALSKVFLSCWNEQKYPLTRMEGVFITLVEKRTVMSLCGVTGRPGHVDRTLRSVLPELQCLSCDRTRPVMIFSLWNLTGVDSTLGPSIRSLTFQCPVAPDEITLVK